MFVKNSWNKSKKMAYKYKKNLNIYTNIVLEKWKY